MKKMNMLVITLAMAFVVLMLNGCGSKQVETGFLSDYSKLQKEGSVLRYLNEVELKQYHSFIVNKVEVHLYEGEKSKGKLTDEELGDLTNYMHAKIVEAIENAGDKVAYHPAAGVARIRIALTDLDASNAVTILPQASLLGAGLGGAATEAEIVDSMTDQQIAAFVMKQKGSRIPFTNLGKWTAAKQAIDNWAKKFQKRIE
jgi:hypothetical protein